MTRLLWVFALLCASGAAAAEFTPHTVRVVDGDTVLVWRSAGERPQKVRLADIDAPESSQPYGDKARLALKQWLERCAVSVDPVAVDRYGRLVAWLRCGETDINHDLVRQGWAWEYSLHHRDKTLLRLEEEARRGKRGLWAGTKPQRPSDWRKQHPYTERKVPDFRCGQRKRCSQMATCDEAHYQLTRCGMRQLDPDGDGVPCESLCGGR